MTNDALNIVKIIVLRTVLTLSHRQVGNQS